MPSEHAVLSASSAYSWIQCPPSVKLCDEFEDVTTVYAQEGTDAHSMCEYKVKKLLGIDVENPCENLEYFNEEMDQCSDDYAAFASEEIERLRQMDGFDPLVEVEKRLEYSRWVPGGFGTGDLVVVGRKELTIIDFKYGQGVAVSAEMNPQMMCYALGALDIWDGIFDFEVVNMKIFQPRISNYSSFILSPSEIYTWADEVLCPAANLAINGEGEFKSGEHCRFCKAKAVCRKRAEDNLMMAKYDFKPPELLEETEISIILDKCDELIKWANDVKDYALDYICRGNHIPGYKVVEGRSVRKYSNEKDVIKAVEEAGFDPYDKKLLPITSMQKRLGKDKFNEILGNLVVKPQGKPTLAVESDKRPPMNSASSDFSEND